MVGADAAMDLVVQPDLAIPLVLLPPKAARDTCPGSNRGQAGAVGDLRYRPAAR